jgi:hypothetical protein
MATTFTDEDIIAALMIWTSLPMQMLEEMNGKIPFIERRRVYVSHFRWAFTNVFAFVMVLSVAFFVSDRYLKMPQISSPAH